MLSMMSHRNVHLISDSAPHYRLIQNCLVTTSLVKSYESQGYIVLAANTVAYEVNR